MQRADRTTFETGRPASRSAHTAARMAFDLGWASMSAANLASLDAAFAADQGGSFSWTDPATTTVYTVIYGVDQIDAAYVPLDRYRVTVTLLEV